MPTPLPDGKCVYERIDQAQRGVAFPIVYPEPVPDGFEFDGISVEFLLLREEMTESTVCEDAEKITLFYPSTETSGDFPTAVVQIHEGTIMRHIIDPDDSDTIEIGGVDIAVETNENIEGKVVQSYSWYIDPVGITVVSLLDETISEDDLLAYVTAMIQD